METLQKLENHFPGPEIEVASGFVGEQNLRPSDQCTGQYDPLLFSARKFTGAVRPPCP